MPPTPTPGPAEHSAIPRFLFSTAGLFGEGQRARRTLPEPIRFAARNRMLARFSYRGAVRVVEPYSLRRPSTGEVLLSAFERAKDGVSTGTIEAYIVDEIGAPEAIELRFDPRWAVEV